MHYYKRNLGDYAKKAGRLSMLQHGSYTLLIDACYDRETFPTLEEAIEWTWASSTAEIEAVQFVLRKFLSLKTVFMSKNASKKSLTSTRPSRRRTHESLRIGKRSVKKKARNVFKA